ncbi:hypothetical protein [Thermus scotoductus]|uniref:hypothetical protein n=1 Tax=Thermus scotoductus TaxID=37636 RepID=UPI0003746904|nr:hypothetical protein [Thermus scotoductus]
MKPVVRLSLEVLRLLKGGKVFQGLALLEAVGVLWRREVRELLRLVEEGKTCDAAVLSVMMVRSPWFHKDHRVRPLGGWKELDPLAAELLRLGEREALEGLYRLKREGTWPEARWLELLHRRYGHEVSADDLLFAVRFLASRRVMVERLGIGVGGWHEGRSLAEQAGVGG